MFSPAYNSAVEYAAEVVKAVRESGYERDYPLEQLICQSARIGETLLMAEISRDIVSRSEYQSNMENSYKDAIKCAHSSLYWIDILERIDTYGLIPFASLKEKCEALQVVLRGGIAALDLLLGKRRF